MACHRHDLEGGFGRSEQVLFFICYTVLSGAVDSIMRRKAKLPVMVKRFDLKQK